MSYLKFDTNILRTNYMYLTRDKLGVRLALEPRLRKKQASDPCLREANDPCPNLDHVLFLGVGWYLGDFMLCDLAKKERSKHFRFHYPKKKN